MSKKKDAGTGELQRVQSQFADWRSTRQSREPIPEELWELVRFLSKRYSIGDIAKALNLSHGNIKKHVLPSEVSAEPASSVDFVDLGLFQPSPSSSSCTLELTNPNGMSMKLSVAGTPSIDVIGLAQTFLGDST